MRDNWKVSSIEDSCDILDNHRIPLNGEQRSLIPGGIPYYGANGVQGYISKYIFDEELILMAEDGGNFEEYSIRPIAYRIKGKSWVNNHAHILRAKNGYNQDFIFYSVVHKNIIPFIKGGTRSKLNLSDLKCVEVSFPKFPQQQKIASILSTCDEVIEKTEAAIAKYQTIKQGLMHDLFTRGIDLNSGKLRPTYQDAPELYKPSELGMIPKDWEVKSLNEIGEVISGGTPSSTVDEFWNGELTWITPSDLSKLRISRIDDSQRKITKLGLNSSSALLIPKNSIVISSRAPIGYCAIVTEEFTTNQGCKSLALYINNNPMFFYYNINQHINRIKIKGEGTTFPEISKKELEKVKFSSCIPKEQNIIATKLEAIDDKIQTEQQALAKHQQLKAGLMQDLLTGKIEVKV